MECENLRDVDFQSPNAHIISKPAGIFWLLLLIWCFLAAWCVKSPAPGRCSVIDHTTMISSKSKSPLLDSVSVPNQGKDTQQMPLSQKKSITCVSTCYLETSYFYIQSTLSNSPPHHPIISPSSIYEMNGFVSCWRNFRLQIKRWWSAGLLVEDYIIGSFFYMLDFFHSFLVMLYLWWNKDNSNSTIK